MNVPLGTCVLEKKMTRELAIKAKLQGLGGSDFTGYIVVLIKGKSMQEGIIFLKGGNVVASAYQYFLSDKIVKGVDALVRSMNALSEKQGLIEIFGYRRSEIDSFLGENKDIIIEKPVSLTLYTLDKMIPAQFNEEYEIKDSDTGKKDKLELVKKFCLEQLNIEENKMLAKRMMV